MLLYADANNVSQSFNQVMQAYRMLHRMALLFNPRHFLKVEEKLAAPVLHGKKRGRKPKEHNSPVVALAGAHWTGSAAGTLDIWKDLEFVASQLEGSNMAKLQAAQFLQIVVELLEYDLAFGNSIFQSLMAKSMGAGTRDILGRVLTTVQRLFEVGYADSERILDLTQRLLHLVVICYMAKTVDGEKFKEQLKNVLNEWDDDSSRAAFLQASCHG